MRYYMSHKMIRFSFVFVIATLLLTPVAAMAENELPSVVLAGLKEYKAKGPEAAVKVWIKGSAFESSVEALSQANSFRQVETMYGSYVGYQVIKVTELSKTSKIVYLSMDYEKGPLFASFLCYQRGDKAILANFFFNMKPDVILPANFFK